MHTIWLIIGILATVLGCTFLFGGFMTLIAPSEAEIEASRAACEAARQKGPWRGFFYSFSEVGSYRFRAPSLLIAHWPERPQSRKFIYVGLAFLAVAAVIGYSMGAFAS